MKNHIIATILTATFAASCAIKVQVKKDAKNSALSQTGSSMNAVASQDFLKQLDGLRTTAADLIIKQMAQRDYVGAFRKSVRTYRKFIIEKSAKPVLITDSFYEDASKDCRSSGLSLNADDHNEMLGMILKTVVLAKLSEADVGKLNAGLQKEMQAITQFITMELGVDIQGTSSATDVNGIKTTKGDVKIKLKPIAGEQIDEQTKHDDDVQVLTLSFERALGSDMIGTFISTMDLAYDQAGQMMEASGNINVSRVKDGDQHVHNVIMSMGTKGLTPSYTREIIVRDNPSDSTKYEFTDVLNAGSANESRHTSVIDLKAGTQCKGSMPKSDPGTKSDSGSKPVTTTKTETKPTTIDTTKSPTQSPIQSPVQSPTQAKVSGAK
jgi:hypothetical protein